MLDDLIHTVAERHGFRAIDYTFVWDRKGFDADRDPRELVIAINDGRRLTVKVSQEVASNPWRTLRTLETAFRTLQRRSKARGAWTGPAQRDSARRGKPRRGTREQQSAYALAVTDR
jgi:hypothetical protein